MVYGIVAFTNSTVFLLDFYIYYYACLVSCFGLGCQDFEQSSYSQLPGSLIPEFTRQILPQLKSCYNPLRLGTVIVLVSSGIDFVNTPRLYSDRATR